MRAPAAAAKRPSSHKAAPESTAVSSPAPATASATRARCSVDVRLSSLTALPMSHGAATMPQALSTASTAPSAKSRPAPAIRSTVRRSGGASASRTRLKPARPRACGRRSSRADDPRAAAMDQEAVPPADEHDKPTLEADEIPDVDDEPEDPGGEPADPDAGQVGDRAGPADRGQVALVHVVERRDRVPLQARAHDLGGV